MEDDELAMEIDWCLTRLEEKLAGMDPYSRPAQEAAKVHRILKSSKAPVIKKRQAMRNTFGDYRAKMKVEQKKGLAAMKKSKLVAVKEPPPQSKFLRRSTGVERAEEPVNSAASSLHQLSVLSGTPDTQAGGEGQGPLGAPGTTSESGATVESGAVPEACASGEGFKFGFDSSKVPAVESVPSTSSSCRGDTNHLRPFVLKPTHEEFRFNFAMSD